MKIIVDSLQKKVGFSLQRKITSLLQVAYGGVLGLMMLEVTGGTVLATRTDCS